jgi:hypothetical protein
MPKPFSPTLPEPAGALPARLWPLGRVLVLIALVLASPVIVYQTWDRIEGRRFWRHIEAIERRGEPVKYAPRRPQTDEQKQASRLYAEALRVPMPANTKLFQDAGRVIEDLAALPPREAARDPRLAELQQVEEPYRRALELLDRAAPRDARGLSEEDTQGSFPTDRLVGSANAVRIARLALSGDGEGAAAALMASLRVRRALPGTSLLFDIVYSDRTAHSLELVLTFSTPSERRLHELQQECARIAEGYRVDEQLMIDRAQFLAFTVPGGEFGGNEYVRPMGPAAALAGRLTRPLWTNRIVAQLQDYEEALEAARAPWPHKLDATRELEEKRRFGSPQSIGGRRPFLVRLVGSWTRNSASFSASRMARAAAQAIARASASVAALGITRYQRAHGGALPVALGDLEPAFGPMPAPDPFTGAELKYVRGPSGYKVYSVGTDREDDRGTFELGSDLIPPPRGTPEDIGLAVNVR